MSNLLQGILNRMGKGIHGVNTPLVAGIVMVRTAHAVYCRVAQVDVG